MPVDKGSQSIRKYKSKNCIQRLFTSLPFLRIEFWYAVHRKFQHKRARYFGLIKVQAQSHLKAICVNLLKAENRIDVSVSS